MRADLSKPSDISLPLKAGEDTVNAFYLSPLSREPFKAGDFVGAVKQGGPCNVYNIAFNPHGNGTHTECVGHISPNEESINDCLTNFHFFATLISVLPTQSDSDFIIMPEHIEAALLHNPQALIIRTLPNKQNKKIFHYSGSNPCYFHPSTTALLAKQNVLHLLTDLPSVDKEEDGGLLLAHHAFWNYPAKPRMNATITELIFVPDTVEDGNYILNLQIASFVNDASPSKPVLYPIIS